MAVDFVNAREAASRLGISASQLYLWLCQSDRGEFVIRGQPVTIDYLQGGPKGQGRIRIDASEIERLNNLMRVRPQCRLPRRPSTPRGSYPGITVKLGRPE
jgi:hypothetical protein